MDRCARPTVPRGSFLAALHLGLIHGCPFGTAMWFGAERLAGFFSYDSFTGYSSPVHPGAFPDPFIRPWGEAAGFREADTFGHDPLGDWYPRLAEDEPRDLTYVDEGTFWSEFSLPQRPQEAGGGGAPVWQDLPATRGA